jgi:hypothetical protein
MANLKYYNETNSEWETLVIGKQGPSGIANATAPVTYDGGTQTVGLTDSFIGQTVRSYADASARAAAIPSPTEGMVTYLEDSDLLSIYETGAWRTSVSPRGGVLQVVRTFTGTSVANSTTTYVDTTLTATITPKSSTSQILVFIDQNGLDKSTGNADNSLNLKLVFPNGTEETFGALHLYTGSATRLRGSISYNSIYSPGSTSPQTFKTQFANFAASASVNVQGFGPRSSMILMEVSN